MLTLYRQVALTYLTRPAVWFIGAVYLAVLSAVAYASHDSSGLLRGDLLMLTLKLGPLMVLAGITAGSQLRHQFAHPAVHLTPGYSQAHIAFALAAYGIVVLGVTAFFATRQQVDMLHALAMATGVFAFSAGWAAGVSPAFTFAFWLVLALYLPLMTQGGQGGHRYSTGGGIFWLTASVLVLCTVFLRLTSQRGEIGRPESLTNPRGRSAIALPWVARWREGRPLPASSFHLWRLGSSPHEPMRLGFTVCIVMLALQTILEQFETKAAYGIWLGFIFAPLFVPSMAAAISVHQRWMRMPQEMLRPVERGRLHRLVIAAHLRDGAVTWLWMAITFLLVYFWMIELTVGLTQGDKARPVGEIRGLLSFVSFSAVLSLATISLVLLLAPFRSFLLLAITAIGVPMVGMIAMNAVGDSRRLEPVHVLIPAALGLILLPLAYLHWRRAEL